MYMGALLSSAGTSACSGMELAKGVCAGLIKSADCVEGVYSGAVAISSVSCSASVTLAAGCALVNWLDAVPFAGVTLAAGNAGGVLLVCLPAASVLMRVGLCFFARVVGCGNSSARAGWMLALVWDDVPFGALTLATGGLPVCSGAKPIRARR